ncbi:hypothetical protein FRC17_010230 [Serendipita sp. 399]|nr:hypothetical protein FRC17_010230 [Serendipita sp. 399]
MVPAEIQESIVLEVALLSPRTISSLSQTCRSLNKLISKPEDHHLWRRIFLALFDDPRPALKLNPTPPISRNKGKSLPYTQSGSPKGKDAAQTATNQPATRMAESTKVAVVEFNWMLETQRRFRARIRMDRAAVAPMEDFDEIVDEDVVDTLMELATLALPASNSYESSGDPDPFDSDQARNSPNSTKHDDDDDDDDDEEGEGEGEEIVEEQERETTRGNKAYLEACLQAAILPEPTTQKVAKLHILCSFLNVHTSVSLPISSSFRSAFRSRTSNSRLQSRAYTYNLSNYREDNHWGPWLPSSSAPMEENGHGDEDEFAVNHVHLWHLINVLRYNAYEGNDFDLPTIGIDGWRAFSALKTRPVKGGEEGGGEEVREWNDWAGIQGVWCRAISFMDYRDLHSYNVSSRNGDGSLRTTVFEQLQFAEAFRLIRAYFTVTHVEEEGPWHHPHRPTIHFVGDTALFTHPAHLLHTNSNGLHHLLNTGAASIHRITKGTVSMTPAGAVRWNFSTRVGGHEWESEGTQIGQVQSRAGVVGVWTSAEHEDGDPAGPFWMWKLGDGPLARTKFRHYHLVLSAD